MRNTHATHGITTPRQGTANNTDLLAIRLSTADIGNSDRSWIIAVQMSRAWYYRASNQGSLATIGFIFGSLVSALGLCAVLWMYTNRMEEERKEQKQRHMTIDKDTRRSMAHRGRDDMMKKYRKKTFQKSATDAMLKHGPYILVFFLFVMIAMNWNSWQVNLHDTVETAETELLSINSERVLTYGLGA